MRKFLSFFNVSSFSRRELFYSLLILFVVLGVIVYCVAALYPLISLDVNEIVGDVVGDVSVKDDFIDM